MQGGAGRRVSHQGVPARGLPRACSACPDEGSMVPGCPDRAIHISSGPTVFSQWLWYEQASRDLPWGWTIMGSSRGWPSLFRGRADGRGASGLVTRGRAWEEAAAFSPGAKLSVPAGDQGLHRVSEGQACGFSWEGTGRRGTVPFSWQEARGGVAFLWQHVPAGPQAQGPEQEGRSTVLPPRPLGPEHLAARSQGPLLPAFLGAAGRPPTGVSRARATPLCAVRRSQ